MELFKLFGTIAIQNADANDAIDDTTDKAEQSESKIGTAFKKIGTAVATYFAVDKIKDFGLNCINAAANAEATASQFSQVFGDLEGQASKSLSSIADTAGITENRMKGSYTKIAAFAKTTGMDTESALGIADRAMIAVADSAAFYDRSLEETTESLQSFLKGNYENDAALGLSCTEVTRNEAANRLYGKSFQDLSESQKQLTLLQMVEDANAASGALGQAARESDTWTNQTGNLQQAWTDFKALIGSNFLPLAVDVIEKMSDGVQSVSEKVPAMVQWFEKYKGVIIGVAAVVGALTAAVALKNTVDTVTTAIQAAKTAMNAAETTTLWGLVAAQTAAIAPYVLIVAAIAAVIAICVLLVKNWDKIKETCVELFGKLQETWENIKAAISEKVEEIKQALLDKWNTIKETVSSVWEGIKSIISTVVNAVKSVISSVFSAIRTTITAILNTIKNVFSSVWNGIKNTVTSVINGVKSVISGGLQGAFSTVSSVLGNIKDKFSSIFESAKDIVKTAIETIKGFFNFSWKLPDIKLPHFSIDGKFSLNPPTIPKFRVSWYRKAMDDPYMFTSPTVFDINPISGQARGAGEAGDEVMIGKDTMLNMIRTAVSDQNGDLIYYMQRLIEMLSDYLPQIVAAEGGDVVLYPDAVVGKLAYPMNRKLAEIKEKEGRGR